MGRDIELARLDKLARACGNKANVFPKGKDLQSRSHWPHVTVNSKELSHPTEVHGGQSSDDD